MTESHVGDVIAERYRLRERVPYDVGDAERWAAEDEILGREVLVTIVSGERAEVALDEARRASLVMDPRLVRILDVGRADVVPYVVIERPRGRTLDDVVLESGPLSGEHARAIVGEVAQALAVAERRGVHHLALRPSAVHLAPGTVQLEGLGLDGALGDGSLGGSRASLPADAAGLGRLLQFALTGQRIADVPVPAGALDGPADDDVEAVALASVARSLLTSLTPGLRAPSALVEELEPWGEVHVPEAPVPAPSSPVPAPAPAAAAAAAEASLEGEASEDVGPAALAAVPGPPTTGAPAASDPAVGGERPANAIDVAEAAVPEGPVVPAPLERTSVRGMLAGTPLAPAVPGAPQPPPAAEPVRRTSVRGGGASLPGGVGAAAAAAAAAGVTVVGSGAGAAAGAVAGAAAGTAAGTAGVAGAGAAGVAGGATGAAGSAAAGTAEGIAPGSAAGGTAGSTPSAPSAAPVGAPAARVSFDAAVLQQAHSAATPTQPRVGSRPTTAARSAEIRTMRFDPTIFTLVVALVLVVGGVLWSMGNLTEFRSPFQWGSNMRPVATDGSDGTQSPPATTPPTLPVIVSAQQLDPDGDDNEHPEAVPRAIDLDPTTGWFTRTYRSATYAGMNKRGLGIAVTFEKPAPVSTVYIQSNSTGGRMEVRATDPSKPDEGTVLYKGPIEKDMEIEVKEPVEAEHIVLWFTELPQTSGQNRAEILEISVS
ncbi:hypothetical protein ACTVCO_00620 [Sanguibacter sp. A247]|uniref:hypothetical protein n=1 Tax=unclassified Sanguibacter TaxID=2645534 RepID=UPI003FD75233